MARKEVTNSALNRYQAQKGKDAGALESDPSLRPKYVQSVESLPQAERWRQSVLADISAKLTKINDPSLTELEIRECNDSLNKLHREKRAWEYHIKKLGGNDYITFGQGSGGILQNGIRYFGRAKMLAEVKHTATREKKSSDKNEKPLSLLLHYYGVFHEQWLHRPIMAEKKQIMEEVNAALGEAVLDAEIGEKRERLPSNADVERWLVQRKKREMMAQLQL